MVKRYDPCDDPGLTDAEKWRQKVGTESTGNLPEYKKNQHIGHCWAPCPYDTNSTDIRTRHMLNLSLTDPLPAKVYHLDQITGKESFMLTEFKGGWGFLCTYSGCTNLINTGKQYFYL